MFARRSVGKLTSSLRSRRTSPQNILTSPRVCTAPYSTACPVTISNTSKEDAHYIARLLVATRRQNSSSRAVWPAKLHRNDWTDKGRIDSLAPQIQASLKPAGWAISVKASLGHDVVAWANARLLTDVPAVTTYRGVTSCRIEAENRVDPTRFWMRPWSVDVQLPALAGHSYFNNTECDRDVVRARDFLHSRQVSRIFGRQQRWELDTLAVSIEHESKGIGTMLLQQLLARCNDAGPDAVCTTMCDASNGQFFEKHGFKRASAIDVTTSYTEHGAEMECDYKWLLMSRDPRSHIGNITAPTLEQK